MTVEIHLANFSENIFNPLSMTFRRFLISSCSATMSLLTSKPACCTMCNLSFILHLINKYGCHAKLLMPCLQYSFIGFLSLFVITMDGQARLVRLQMDNFSLCLHQQTDKPTNLCLHDEQTVNGI
jgi:hypothetical protein